MQEIFDSCRQFLISKKFHNHKLPYFLFLQIYSFFFNDTDRKFCYSQNLFRKISSLFINMSKHRQVSSVSRQGKSYKFSLTWTLLIPIYESFSDIFYHFSFSYNRREISSFAHSVNFDKSINPPKVHRNMLDAKYPYFQRFYSLTVEVMGFIIFNFSFVNLI